MNGTSPGIALIIIDAICYAQCMVPSATTSVLPARHRNDRCCVSANPPGLSSKQSKLLAKRLRAVADPTRLRILDLLGQQPEALCVCDITPNFQQNQPTVSHHLKVLREAGLVDTEKRGIWSYYWITEKGVNMLNALDHVA
ncbi:MAG: ArsR/SmtB family transcription factor [Chloroflexota bacterium]